MHHSRVIHQQKEFAGYIDGDVLGSVNEHLHSRRRLSGGINGVFVQTETVRVQGVGDFFCRALDGHALFSICAQDLSFSQYSTSATGINREVANSVKSDAALYKEVVVQRQGKRHVAKIAWLREH